MNKKYDALVDVATSSVNTLPGPLGSPNAPTVDLVALAKNLCDAFEYVTTREASWTPHQQLTEQ